MNRTPLRFHSLLAICSGIFTVIPYSSSAQIVPSLPSPAVLTMDGPKGTLTQSVSAGTTSSLSFGSSANISVGATLSSTSATSSSSNANLVLAPSSSGGCDSVSCIQTRLGYGSEAGVIRANIENLKSSEQNTSTFRNSLTSSNTGQAELSGVQAVNQYMIDGSSSALNVGLQTLHENDAGRNQGITQDGEGQVGSGSATINSSSNMNAVINNNQFVNVFQQAY